MTRPRDPLFEEGSITAAGRSVDNIARLVNHARSRADAGGSNRPPVDRDMRKEALEELADCANYVVWNMQEVLDGTSDADPAALTEALSGLAHIYGVLASQPGRRSIPPTHQLAGAVKTVRIAGTIYEIGDRGELRIWEGS